jgi:hypothetical protein
MAASIGLVPQDHYVSAVAEIVTSLIKAFEAQVIIISQNC